LLKFKVEAWFEKFTFIGQPPIPDDFLDTIEEAVAKAVREAGGKVIGVTAYRREYY
jgi:hypothetical protein